MAFLRSHGAYRTSAGHLAGPNTSTLSKGLADQGRKRFTVNLVFCPG
jgi:hypothetical protein